MVRLVVLGCSGGYPAPNRACSGYLVETARSRIWLDAGSGTLSRLFARCSLADVDAVWLTHLHPDHWTDLPLAIHALAIGASRVEEAIAIYGPEGWASPSALTSDGKGLGTTTYMTNGHCMTTWWQRCVTSRYEVWRLSTASRRMACALKPRGGHWHTLVTVRRVRLSFA